MDFSVRLEKLEAGGGSASRDTGVLYQKVTEERLACRRISYGLQNKKERPMVNALSILC